MNINGWPSELAYFIVFIAAAIEGEVVFVTASVLVSLGRLDAVGVLVAGALGGSAGDQFYFYAFRGRLSRWLSRFPSIARRQNAVSSRVKQHSNILILASRFLPGLRIAIPIACAYAHVPAFRFSTLNLISAFGWAGTIMLIVAYGGPVWMARIGLPGWWGILVPAVFMVLFFRWLGRASTQLEDPNAE